LRRAVTPTDAFAAPADSQPEMPVSATLAPMRHTAVIAVEQSDDKTFVVPPPPPEPASGTKASPDAPPPESVVPAPQDTAEFMHRQAGQEVREQTADTAQADLEKHEAQQLADRLAAARQEAARAEAARQEAERGEAARIQEAKDEEERRLARRLAMGRQLDEEAAQRQAAATRPPLPLSLSTARRVRLWGRSDPNVELVLYAENWVRRIQLNTPVDTVRQLAGRRHTAPMVTVAVRSDGSVEAVTLVVSSGVPEVDEAIRRIVQNNVPYPPFPPRLARQYDVVEIRRTWHFDTAIRLD
jgi:TonB family protein